MLGFIKQVCNKTSANGQPAWHPDLPDSCKNGLLISEKVYFMVRIVHNAYNKISVRFIATPLDRLL